MTLSNGNSTLRGMEIVEPAIKHQEALGSFFQLLVKSGDDRFFHPHPLTTEAAGTICQYSGKDYYCLLMTDQDVVAYGMLRGWDEGFEVPSLGIAVSPRYRSIGAGRALMEFLHVVAKLRRCSQVMLKVSEDNFVAAALYQSLGYEFDGRTDGMLVGRIDF